MEELFLIKLFNTLPIETKIPPLIKYFKDVNIISS